MPDGQANRIFESSRRRFLPFLSVSLGLFILAQAIFLPLANALDFLPRLRMVLKNKDWAHHWAGDWLDKTGSTYEALKRAQRITDCWQELTGQPEQWSLFAPDVSEDIWFIGVKINYGQAQEDRAGTSPMNQSYSYSLLSENEPVDTNGFFRLGGLRMRRYEMALEVSLYDYKDFTQQEIAAKHQDKIKDKVAEDWQKIMAYLRYRRQSFMEAHPDLPEPEELILSVRHYEIPSPETSPFRWREPDEIPVARWRPNEPPSTHVIPVERYDPVSGSFVAVNR